jgi:lipoprotein-anchoring transpeptidase ErfK/SrfK
MRKAALVVVLALAAAGCGSNGPSISHVLAEHVQRCRSGEALPLGSQRVAYAAIAPRGAGAYRTPGHGVVARFGRHNANGYPTVFGVLGAVVDARCNPRWYRVQIPVKPNGTTAYVRASRVKIGELSTRIVVDVSARRLTLYRGGRPVLKATVAVGSPATPTPTGRYYVNQRLIPDDPSGPYGPAALGISAFSNVLTGGPVAIHGTNEPWSIGRAVSNGCIRLPNATLSRIYPLVLAGTPVIIRA